MQIPAEPRPTLNAVFAEKAAAPVERWLRHALKQLTIDDAKVIMDDLDKDVPQATIRAMVFAAAEQTSAEHKGKLCAYRVAKAFEDALNWPADAELVCILHETSKHTHEQALRLSTMHWVLRFGARFPNKVDDVIKFRRNGASRSGKVRKVDAGTASAEVKMFGSKGDKIATVYAEDIVTEAPKP